MDEPFSRPISLLLLAVILVGVFLAAGLYVGNDAISALSGALSVILSGLLVLLYRQQKDVLERQERIMEADYKPMLSYDNSEFIALEVQTTFGDGGSVAHEAAKFEAHNYGQGRALNIRTEIVVSTGVTEYMETDEMRMAIGKIALTAPVSHSASREDDGLEKPYNSLEANESARFLGKPHFRYLPTATTESAFQDFEPPQIDIGDLVTAMIVVEYDDILGNTYRDVPFCRVSPYVPNTALHSFPAVHEDLLTQSQWKFYNVNVE